MRNWSVQFRLRFGDLRIGSEGRNDYFKCSVHISKINCKVFYFNKSINLNNYKLFANQNLLYFFNNNSFEVDTNIRSTLGKTTPNFQKESFDFEIQKEYYTVFRNVIDAQFQGKAYRNGIMQQFRWVKMSGL